jgi:hypothetical protein
MNIGNIGPTMVVAMPLKMKPTKRIASNPVLLPVVRSGIATVVVTDMCAKHSEAARRRRQPSRGKDRDYVGRENSCTLFAGT